MTRPIAFESVGTRARAWWVGSVGSAVFHGALIVLATRVFSVEFRSAPVPNIEIDFIETPSSDAASVETNRLTAARPTERQRQGSASTHSTGGKVHVLRKTMRAVSPVVSVSASVASAESPTADASTESGPAAPSSGNALNASDRNLESGVGANGGDIFSAEASDRIAKGPEFIDVDPLYPPQAERDAIEGHVVLEVDVDRRGLVRAVKVLSRAGFGMDESAIRAIRNARVRPALNRQGAPVDCRIRHTIHFRPVRNPLDDEGGST